MKKEVLFRWLFPLLIVISFLVNYIGIFDSKMDTNGDNYYYYLLAESLAQGKGYVDDIGPVPVPHMHFPPGYPAFMALFLKIFPDNITAMKILNGILLLASLLLLYHIVRKTAGRYGPFIALVSCLLCTFHPELLRWATILMSEMLYLFVSLAIIAICLHLDFERLARKDGRQILLVILLCLLVFSTYYIRTMGVSVVLAVLLALFVLAIKRRKWAPVVVCGAVALSLLAAHESWSLRNHRVAPDYQSDYLNNFIHKSQSTEKMATARDWTGRIGTNFKLFTAWFIPKSILTPKEALKSPEKVQAGAKEWFWGILVLALIVLGALSMKGLEWLLLAYGVITFGVLMIYQEQFAGVRYFVPVLPLLIAAFVAGVSRVLDGLLGKMNVRAAWPGAILPFILLVALAPGYWESQSLYRYGARSDFFEKTPQMQPMNELIQASQAMQDAPEDALTAVLKPEIYYVQSKGHHAIPLPRSGTPEDIIQYFRDNRVEAVIVDRWFKFGYSVVYPAIENYPQYFYPYKAFGSEEGNQTQIFLFLPNL